MNVIAYARFSTHKQSEGNSVERQLELAEAYATSRGWSITETVIDAGKSAYKAKHKTKTGGLGKLIERFKKGQLGQGDVLLVEALDRLSREDVMTALAGLDNILDSGVTLITTTNGQIITKAGLKERWTDVIVLMTKMATAHEESTKRAARTSDNWKRRRAEGHWTFNTFPAWLDQNRQPIAERVEDVRMIFDLADQGLGRMRIARKMTEAGRKVWGNGQKRGQSPDWSEATVSKILHNRAVLGECQPYEAGEPLPVVLGYYPQIIETDQFNRVHSVVKKKFGGEGSGRHANTGNIFRDVFKCGCGRNMVLVASNGERYLKCTGANRGGCTAIRKQKTFRYDQLEKGILSAIREMKFVDDTSTTARKLETEKAELVRLIEIREANADKLIEMELNAELAGKPSPAISRRREAEEAKVNEAKVRLEEVKAELTLASRSMTTDQADVVNLYDQFASVDDALKPELRQRINAVLKRIVRMMIVGDIISQVTLAMNDGSVYRFVYGLRPDVPQKAPKAGQRPASDYGWQLVAHTTPQDLEAAIMAEPQSR